MMTAVSTNIASSLEDSLDFERSDDQAAARIEELELFKIEKQIAENKLRHELIEYHLKTMEQQLAEIEENINLSKMEYQQSYVEVQNCKIETREVKSELYDLQQFTIKSILNLNQRLDQLISSSSEVDPVNMAKNVQLVLDQYINAKISKIDEEEEEEEEEDNDNDNDNEMGDDEQEEETPGNEVVVDTSDIQMEGSETDEGKATHTVGYLNHPQLQTGSDGEIKYSLAKDVQTVDKIWIEYSRGIHGGPSIKELEEKYQTKWRYKMENSTFLRRKRVYKAIEYAIENLKYDENEAIEELENYRFDEVEKRKRPMYWLYDNIPAKFKANT